MYVDLLVAACGTGGPTSAIQATAGAEMMLNKVSQKAFMGGPLAKPSRAAAPLRAARLEVTAADERYRLHNLSPQEGARRDNKRKGRGYGGHQGGTCGFGNRGQKSRSGSSVRPGFEGGQTPLYRRLPKLRGIAGGMPAGVSKFNVVNLSDLDAAFAAGEEVTLAAVQEKNLLRISGRERSLPLKVLGEGELSKPLVIKAASFSAAAAEKISAAGATAEKVPGRANWTRRAHEKKVKEMAEKGLDYAKEMSKKRAAAKVAKAQAAAAARTARAAAAK